MPKPRRRSRAPEAPRTPDSVLSRLPDGEIVTRCLDGDEDAWRTLVLRYRRLVYTIPYRMGLDPSDSDDVFQITFARLAERIGRLRNPERVRAWLVTTTRRVSLNIAGRRREVEPELPANMADPADLPSEELERLEQEQLVQAALEGLGERCRRLLTLLYYPDLRTGESKSYEAVARVMGIPVGSIGPSRMRCLKRLLAQYRKLSGE